LEVRRADNAHAILSSQKGAPKFFTFKLRLFPSTGPSIIDPNRATCVLQGDDNRSHFAQKKTTAARDRLK
jgi:hypothetical protein